jgi:hypothetical protein
MLGRTGEEDAPAFDAEHPVADRHSRGHEDSPQAQDEEAHEEYREPEGAATFLKGAQDSKAEATARGGPGGWPRRDHRTSWSRVAPRLLTPPGSGGGESPPAARCLRL